MTALQDFLRRAAGEPFRHGEWDCAMTVANWVRCQTGHDPAPHLRGRYSTARGWMRIVRRARGLDALAASLATKAGMWPTMIPRPGDIGVIDVPGLGPAGAIRVERGWAAKLDDGLTVADFEMFEAWKFIETGKF